MTQQSHYWGYTLGKQFKTTHALQCSSQHYSQEAGHGDDSDAGKDGGQKEKGAAEDEMAGWHH